MRKKLPYCISCGSTDSRNTEIYEISRSQDGKEKKVGISWCEATRRPLAEIGKESFLWHVEDWMVGFTTRQSAREMLDLECQ